MQTLIWLTSYPKSGNTWMRAFIANLTDEKQEEPVNINEFATGAIASSRGWIDEVIGYDSVNLSHEEIDRLRPLVYRWSAEQQEQWEEEGSYHKVHDAWTRLPDGSPLFPVDVTCACLYIVRNPLDVAVSLAYHGSIRIEHAVKQMGWPEMSFCGSNRKTYNQLRQKLLTWSEHVESWMEAPGMNLKIVRYEDMLFSPGPTFAAVADFLGIREGDVEKAIDASRMEKLQQMEQESRFNVAPSGAVRFFRKGKAGDWQQRLRPDQVKRVIRDHGAMMRKLGYLDSSDVPQIKPLATEELMPMLVR